MAFNLGDFLRGAAAQINPFDGGQTFASVQTAAKKKLPPPASTARPNQAALTTQINRMAGIGPQAVATPIAKSQAVQGNPITGTIQALGGTKIPGLDNYSLSNAYNDFVQKPVIDPVLEGGRQLTDLANGKKVDPAKFAANTAITGLNAATFGRGGTLLQGGESLLKRMGVGALEQAGFGAGIGAAQTLHDGGKPSDYLANAGVGAAFGGLIGGATPVAGDAARFAAKNVKNVTRAAAHAVQHATDALSVANKALGESGFISAQFPKFEKPTNTSLAPWDQTAIREAQDQVQALHVKIAQHQDAIEYAKELINSNPAISTAQKQAAIKAAYKANTAEVNATKQELGGWLDHINKLDPTGTSHPVRVTPEGGVPLDTPMSYDKQPTKLEQLATSMKQVLGNDRGAVGLNENLGGAGAPKNPFNYGSMRSDLFERAAKDPSVDLGREAYDWRSNNANGFMADKSLDRAVADVKAALKAQAEPPKPPLKPQSPLPESAQSPVSSTPIVAKTKRAPQSLNTDRLNISDAAKGEVNALSQADPVTKMTDKEVQDIARNAGIDAKSNTIDQTRQKVAEQLNLRKKIVSVSNQADKLLEEGKIAERSQLMRQIYDFSHTSTEQGADIARQLSARRILANELDTPMQRIFKLLDKEGINPDVAIEKMSKVDFNDANAVVKAYRELVPPKAKDWLDTLRYNSMLSSPLTQINNLFPNLESTAVITPVEKTITGVLDAAHSLITKKPRQFAIGEGSAYAKGYFSSFGEAKRRFSESMSGLTEAKNLDMKGNVPLFAKGQNKVYDTLAFPMKLMEAMDGFFTGLTEGGVTKALEARQAAGFKTPNIANQAGAESAYRLYRQDLGDKSQSTFLQALDIPAQKLMELRNSSNPYVSYPAKFTVPFVRTTMNIFKQGFEYSPAGVLALHGSTSKTEQVSKMLLGTTVVGTAASLLGQEKLTWSQPTNPKQLEAWKAAGMQPYSVKIGDNWVSFQKLPPALSFNLALVAAIDDAQKNAKINQNGLDNIMSAAAKYGQFLSDQSYTKSAGNFLKAVQGDGQAATQLASGYPQQLVPFRALLNWFATMTDDTQRKINKDASFADQQIEALMQVIPGVRRNTTSVKDANDMPVPAQHPVLNAFSPVKVSTEDWLNADYYKMLKKASLDKANNAILKKEGQPTVSKSTGSTTLDASNKRVEKATSKLPGGISTESASIIKRYALLSADGKAKFTSDPKNKLKLDQAMYEQNKLSGKLTGPKDLATQQSLARQAVTSNYSKDVLDFYALSKAQQNQYFKTNPADAKALYDQAKQLDAQLVKQTGTTTKFKTSTKVSKGKKGKYNYAARLSTKKSSTGALRRLIASSKIKSKKVSAKV